MSNVSSSANKQQAAPKNLFWSILTLPLTLFGVMCGSLLLSVIVEIAGMHLFWKDDGWHHAESMFYFELEQFSAVFKQSLFVSEPVEVTHRILEQTYDWLFIKSGLLKEMQAITTPHDLDSARKLRFREYIGLASGVLKEYLLAAALTALTCVLRMMVLFFSLPMIFIAIFVGFVDGLVQRDIRRFTAEYESGFIYHRAKAFLIPLIVLPWTLYLALPVSVYPQFILLPGATMLGIAVSITASRFKKYL